MVEKNPVRARLIYEANASLAEGPVWWEERQRLVWVDILEKQIHLLDPLTCEDSCFQLDTMVSAACPMVSSAELLIATANGVGVFSIDDENVRWLHDPEDDKPENRFNDGKIDPAGRFWAGTMCIDCSDTQNGALYRQYDSNTNEFRLEKVLSGVSISNGLAWYGDRMFYVDTPTRRVDVFDYNPDSGKITNRQPFIEVGPQDGLPDGLTIDDKGNLWLAHWGAGCVVRYSVETGDRLGKVTVPMLNVSSVCCNGNDFYVTTAKSGDRGGSIFGFRFDD